MVVEIILGVIALIVSFLAFYLNTKKDIEGSITGAINEVENLEALGEEKMNQAIEILYKKIPIAMKPFFSKAAVRELVQMAFDEMIDFANKQK